MVKKEPIKKEPDKKIELKDLSTWIKIAVIGWLAYLGLAIISVILAVFSALSGTEGTSP